MAVDYICAVNKDHPRQIFGTPQTQPPMCCGKPMTIVAGAAQPVAVAGRASRKSRKGAAPKSQPSA
jgi:hypothetical protein